MFVFQSNHWIPPLPEPRQPERGHDERMSVSWALVGFAIALAPASLAVWGTIVWLIIG